MPEQSNDVLTTRFLLRMSKANYNALKQESQRMSISMTSLINVILDNFVKSQNPQNDGEESRINQ
jgi:hypothetical protein